MNTDTGDMIQDVQVQGCHNLILALFAPCRQPQARASRKSRIMF